MRHLYTFGFGILALGGTARADDAAKLHVEQGTKLYSTQRYAEAAVEYEAAYLLDPKPELLYAIAQSHRLGGDCTKALTSYQAYLRTGPLPAERAKAQANIDRCTERPHVLDVAVQASDLELPHVPIPPQPVEAELDRSPAKSYLIGHVLVGAGVAAAGVGSYFYWKGRSAISAHNDAATYDDFIGSTNTIDDARGQQQLGMSALAVGGAVAIGGVVYYVMRARSDNRPNITAHVTGGSTTITLSRSF